MSDIVTEVFEAVGAASMCRTEDGVFDEQRAIGIAEHLLDYIRSLEQPDMSHSRARRLRTELEELAERMKERCPIVT